MDYDLTNTYMLLNKQIAPIIHEWTYDAMCHDLLNMDGNKYTHEVSLSMQNYADVVAISSVLWAVIETFSINVKVPSKTGSTTEKKEVLLEDHDPIWLELRDAHIADVSF